MIVRCPEAAFRWCRTQKDISAPLLMEGPLPNASGCYYHQKTGETFVLGRHVPLDKGLIVISTIHIRTLSDEAEVFSHEWRHHWQLLNGWKYDGKPLQDWGDYDAWAGNVARYFRTSRSERDALHFSIAKAGTDNSMAGPLLDYAPDLYGRSC